MGTPITLTPQQFAKTSAAKRGGTYQGYLKYVARARQGGTKTTPAATGLEQTPSSAINALVKRVLGMYGSASNPSLAPRSDKQIQDEARTYAESQTQPLIDEVTRKLGSRANAGMASIAGLSKELMAAEQPAAAGYAHDALQAAAARSAIGQNLAGEASAQGQQAESSVAGKLAQIGAGDVSGVFAKNAGALGAQLGSDVGVHGATGAADVVNRGAANAGKASALPGITGLAALRSGRLLQEQTNQNLADQVGGITKSLPGLVQSIFENLKSREMQKEGAREGIRARKAGAAASLVTHLGDQNVQKALAAQGFGLDLTKLGVDAGLAETRNGIAQENADTAARRADAAAVKAAATASGKDANTVRVATSKAITKATSYLDKYVKPQPVYQRVLDNSTTPPTYKQVVTGYKGFPAYYSVIHDIEARVAPTLSQVGMSQAEITLFVQRLVNANPHYKPGQNGRPGTGVHTASTSPTAASGHPLP